MYKDNTRTKILQLVSGCAGLHEGIKEGSALLGYCGGVERIKKDVMNEAFAEV